MSTRSAEPTIADRVAERPALDVSKIRKIPPRHLLYRFLTGALTSSLAGIVSIAFGARIGGIMLAFPAILAASLTLIEEQEDSVHAREDARGAVVGGCALTIFAIVVALLAGHLAGVLVLALATGGWLLLAVLCYVALWLR